MISMAFIVGIAAFVSTMLGGALALRLRDRLHLILGFSAGAVVAVAFFDLLPEAIDLGRATHDAATIFTFAAVGFFIYLFLDRVLLLHGHTHDGGEDHVTEARGSVRAASLSVHSFLDGIAVGLAFQVNVTAGLVVAVAVLAHDFSDGINTVSVIVRHGGSGRAAYKNALRWLVVDAAAPLLGILVTTLFTVSQDSLSLLLALFAGFFLYIGASDLIPESHHQHPKFMTTAMTLLGAFVLYVAIHFAA